MRQQLDNRKPKYVLVRIKEEDIWDAKLRQTMARGQKDSIDKQIAELQDKAIDASSALEAAHLEVEAAEKAFQRVLAISPDTPAAEAPAGAQRPPTMEVCSDVLHQGFGETGQSQIKMLTILVEQMRQHSIAGIEANHSE